MDGMQVVFNQDNGTWRAELIEGQGFLGAGANLALACDRCNLQKGPNLAAIDPETGTVVPLFHPRNNTWQSHFEMQGAVIVGKTSTGRATVRLLMMNELIRLRLRDSLIELGEF